MESKLDLDVANSATQNHLQFICKSIAICILPLYHANTMMVSPSRLRFRRWITGLLLAAYGCAGVLGYGLHVVWECEHHCHVHAHAYAVAQSHSHDHGHCCHHHHVHQPAVVESGDNHKAIESAVDACPICEFLVQAQTPVVTELVKTSIGPACFILTSFDSTHIAPYSGVSSARGPPLS
jgi:hypothetical protein